MKKYKDFDKIFSIIEENQQPITFTYKGKVYTAPQDTSLKTALALHRAAKEHGTDTQEFGDVMFKESPNIIGQENYKQLVQDGISGFQLGCICRYVLNAQAGMEEEESPIEETLEDGLIGIKKK